MCEGDRHVGLLLTTFANHGFMNCTCSSTFVLRSQVPNNNRFQPDVQQTYTYKIIQTAKGSRCVNVTLSSDPTPEFYGVSAFDRRGTDHKLRPVHFPRPIMDIRNLDPSINTNSRAKLAFRYARGAGSRAPVAVGVRLIREEEEEQYLQIMGQEDYDHLSSRRGNLTITKKLARQLQAKFDINVNYHEEESTTQFDICAGQNRELVGFTNLPPLLNLALTAHLTVEQLNELDQEELTALRRKGPTTKITPLFHSRSPGQDARIVNDALSGYEPPADRAFVLLQLPYQTNIKSLRVSDMDLATPGTFDKLFALHLLQDADQLLKLDPRKGTLGPQKGVYKLVLAEFRPNTPVDRIQVFQDCRAGMAFSV